MKPESCGKFGVITFVARKGNDCISQENDLLTSWVTSQILGNCQLLLPIRHKNLCAYLDIIKCKHDRMLVVSEYLSENVTMKHVHNELTSDTSLLSTMCCDILSGLQHLHDNGLCHGNLTPAKILYQRAGRVFKLTEFSLLMVKGYGMFAPPNFDDVRYLPPEILRLGPNPTTPQLISAVQSGADLWSFGLILGTILQVVDTGASVSEWISTVLGREGNLPYTTKDFDPVLQPFVEIVKNCLEIDPVNRPTAVALLEKIGSKSGLVRQLDDVADLLWTPFPSMQYRPPKPLPNADDLRKDPLRTRSIDESYRLWKLSGGDLNQELKQHGFLQLNAPILDLPVLECLGNRTIGRQPWDEMDPPGVFLELDMKPVHQKIEDLPLEVFCPLLSRENDQEDVFGAFLTEMRQQPLVVRENNAKYQLCRQILFHRLLSRYPYMADGLRKEAQHDIPPLYRNLVWACLLGVQGNVAERYEWIDKDSPGVSDRQIDVDIPRCHQYNALMASKEAHGKLKRLLKAWIVDHPQFVYWQGLDSLTAPFLYLNFTNEALAYSCLCAFVEKYVHKFFLRDNTHVIHEYLAVFSHLLAYHDPVLSTHLSSVGFLPELYSIPWFLTMFTHVFPLHKVFHLWDRLLLGDDSYPLFIGLSLLIQLRPRLLSCGFNECILLFSDFPDLDIQSCLQLADDLIKVTPKSVSYRSNSNQMSFSSQPDQTSSDLEKYNSANKTMELEVLRSEVSPRITWAELQELSSTPEGAPTKALLPIVLVDSRSSEEYTRGTLPHSLNIPFLTAFGSDGDLIPTFEAVTLQDHKGKLVVVFDGKCTNAPKMAAEIVRLGFPYVTVLHQGIDRLKASAFITVPTSS